MKLLVDTAPFIWANEDSERLSKAARNALADTSNHFLFSIVSAWEIAIKVSLGKLRAPSELAAILDRLGATLLPVSLEHTALVREMPFHHRDPFDRMLVAQARHEGAVLVTGDPIFRKYGVATLW